MSKDTVAFAIGDIVYHVVDDDPGIVTAIIYRDTGVTYEVTWTGRMVDDHTGIELSRERVYHPASKGKDSDKEGSGT